jgi:hypothetical protein
MSPVKIATLFLFIWFSFPLVVAAQPQLEMVKNETSDKNVAFLETTIQIGKSTLYYMPAAEHSLPVSVNVSLRIMDLFGPSATLLIGSSIDEHGVKQKDRMLSATFEIRMAPEFWNWYRPKIGVGWFYSENHPYISKDVNRGLFCSISMVEIAPDRLAFAVHNKEYTAFFKPILSFGTVKYGPIVPWGSRWTDNKGNFFLGIELFSAGVVWG